MIIRLKLILFINMMLVASNILLIFQLNYS